MPDSLFGSLSRSDFINQRSESDQALAHGIYFFLFKNSGSLEIISQWTTQTPLFFPTGAEAMRRRHQQGCQWASNEAVQ